MAVTVHLVGKQYVRIEDTNDAAGVWARIKRGEPIATGGYGQETIFNPDNVTNVAASR